jgi:hypothetical protein
MKDTADDPTVASEPEAVVAAEDRTTVDTVGWVQAGSLFRAKAVDPAFAGDGLVRVEKSVRLDHHCRGRRGWWRGRQFTVGREALAEVQVPRVDRGNRVGVYGHGGKGFVGGTGRHGIFGDDGGEIFRQKVGHEILHIFLFAVEMH